MRLDISLPRVGIVMAIVVLGFCSDADGMIVSANEEGFGRG